MALERHQSLKERHGYDRSLTLESYTVQAFRSTFPWRLRLFWSRLL